MLSNMTHLLKMEAKMMLNKIFKWGVIGVMSIVPFIIATAFHRLTSFESGGIINDVTQIQYIPSFVGICVFGFCLILSMVASFMSRGLMRMLSGKLLSFGFCIIRFIGVLSLISGGTNIYIFHSKLGQVIQLLIAIAVIVLHFVITRRSKFIRL